MRILIIKRDPLSWADGISQFIFSLTGAFLRLGHEVTCATTHDVALEQQVRERYALDPCPRLEALVRRDRMADWRKFFVWRRAGAALVQRCRPDLIILNGAVPVRFGVPTILVAHDVERRWLGPLGPLGRILYKRLTYRLVDRVVTTCPELVEPVARESQMDARNITVIPTCIDLARYTAHPLAEREPLILHLGQQKYKQPGLSLAALQKMQHTEARLVVTGQPERAFLRALEKAPAAVRERVGVSGVLPARELKELLAKARVVSVPSRYAQPVASPTVLEALATHTPAVVSSSVSAQMARPGETCFVENTPAGMARRFDELFTNTEIWERLSRRCAEVKQQFDALVIAQRYLALAGSTRPPAGGSVDAAHERG